MAKEIELRGKIWYTNFYHEGERIRVTTGCTNEKDAKKALTRLKARYLDAPKRSDKTWSDALIKWLKAEARSASDKLAIGKLGYEDRRLDQCTKESFEEIFEDLSELNDWAPATYNRYVARVAAILNLSGLHIKFDKKPVGEGRLRFLTRDEWERLYDELPDHIKPMARLAINTGLRRHNITHLEWTEVDLKRECLWVHPDQAKAEKAIAVPLSVDAINVLEEQWTEDDEDRGTYVFQYRGGPMVSPKRSFNEACARAGITDFTWHGLRHTWASWHIMHGTPLEVLRVLGGWKDMRMVMKYAHLDPGYVSQYANNARPYDKEK